MFDFIRSIIRRFSALESEIRSLRKELLRAEAARGAMTSRIEALFKDGAQRDADVHEGMRKVSEQFDSMRREERASFLHRLEAASTHFSRNYLPNDSSAIQKMFIAIWHLEHKEILTHRDLSDSGFRVFSQNDEDGVLLRLFSHIGVTNRQAIEIGSNCSGSHIEIPENLSSNLIVNHGWHGVIIEMDVVECDRIRHFFARDYATRHFHQPEVDGAAYFSPIIIPQMVSADNINDVLRRSKCDEEPDLLVLDIDGGDYAVMSAIKSVRPRVVVVEFEKRFRNHHSVIQRSREDFSRAWPQSGSVSLPAWDSLLAKRGYCLCAMSSSGFNAVFVRNDVAEGRLEKTSVSQLFDAHPVFAAMGEGFWISPDSTWTHVS